MARNQRISSYAVVVDEGRILLCRLTRNISERQEWTLPGGGLEFGEHPEQAVVREVREETGLDVNLGGLMKVDSEVLRFKNGRMHAVRMIYRATPTGGELTNEVNGSTDCCGWFTKEEVAKLPLVTLARIGVRLAFGGGRRRTARRPSAR